MSNLTARFKQDSFFVLEILSVGFDGGHVSRKIIAPKIDIDFAIHDFIEHDHHYDIIVSDTTIGVCDGGEKLTILNVPKNMITIAGKNSG